MILTEVEINNKRQCNLALLGLFRNGEKVRFKKKKKREC